MTNGLVQSVTLALSLALAATSLAAGDILFSDAPQLGATASGCLLDEADCECNSCPSSFWFAGVEATMLQAVVRSGGEIRASFSDTTAPGLSTVAFQDGNGLERFTFAPRLWIGRQVTERWGLALRYWDLTSFDTHAPAPVPAIPNVGTNFATIFETDNARLYTVDFEAIRSFAIRDWKIDGTAGVRHARVGATSDILSFGVFTTGNFINLTLQNGFSFEGTGGTGALIARRQIGDSPVQFFLAGRGSYLGGFTDSFGRVVGTVASSPAAPLVGAATVSRNDAAATATIAELQTGLQLDHPLAFVPASAFVRATFEYQNWIVHGLRTGGAGFGGTIGELTTNSFASAGLGRANLVGLSLATGVNW